MATDRSGFSITNISGIVKSEGERYFIEDLSIETPNSYLQPSQLSYDMSADIFNLVLKKGELTPIDFIAFLPNIKYLNHKIYPSIQANGMLPSIQISEFNLKYGDYEMFDASAFCLLMTILKMLTWN